MRVLSAYGYSGDGKHHTITKMDISKVRSDHRCVKSTYSGFAIVMVLYLLKGFQVKN